MCVPQWLTKGCHPLLSLHLQQFTLSHFLQRHSHFVKASSDNDNKGEKTLTHQTVSPSGNAYSVTAMEQEAINNGEELKQCIVFGCRSPPE